MGLQKLKREISSGYILNFIEKIIWRLKGKKIQTFLHIPKTAGTYIAQLETKNKSTIFPIRYLRHAYIIDRPNEINKIYLEHDLKSARSSVVSRSQLKKCFVFSNVRNIFDWLVSYASHAGGWNPKYRDKNHYDYELANKGFSALLKAMANRKKQWPGRRFIFSQLFSSSGDLIVDWINRTEVLNTDLKKMASYIKCSYKQKKKQRVSKRKRDYHSYYNAKLIKLVRKTWGRELKLFGYSFDGLNSKNAVLSGRVTKKQKQNIKYFWDSDRLVINGKEIKRTF